MPASGDLCTGQCVCMHTDPTPTCTSWGRQAVGVATPGRPPPTGSAGRYLTLKAGRTFYPANICTSLFIHRLPAGLLPPTLLGHGHRSAPGPPRHHPSPPGSPQGRTPAALLTHPPAPSPLSSGPPTSVPLNSEGPSTHCSDLTLPPHHGLTHLHCLNIPETLGAFEPRVNSKDTHTAALHSSLCCPPTSQAQLSKVLVLRRSPLLGLSRNAPSTGSVKRPPCHLTPPSPPHSPQGIQAPTVSPRRAWSKHRTLLPGFSAVASAAEKPARALKPSPGPHGAAQPLTGLQGAPSLSE